MKERKIVYNVVVENKKVNRKGKIKQGNLKTLGKRNINLDKGKNIFPLHIFFKFFIQDLFPFSGSENRALSTAGNRARVA